MSPARRRLSAVPQQPATVVMYVRVSALMGRGGDTFHSPDMQLDAMRALAQRRDLREVEVVQDIDRTGRDFQREGIARVMELARAGQVDVVALYDLSRLGRNTGESLRMIRELRELGVSIVSTTEQIDDSPEGQFMLGQFLGMAQLYSDQIGRRWKEVNARRAQQGHFHGSNPPVGYQLAEGNLLVVDPHVGPAVTRTFQRYADGHQVAQIARDLGEARGRPHAMTTLKQMLGNVTYIGQVRYDGQTFPGLHERLVDDATWGRVQDRLGRDRRTPSRRLAISHSLVGLVLCDACGYHLQLHHDPARGPRGPRGGGARPRRAFLQCRRPGCPGPGRPPLAGVEAAVIAELPAYLERLKVDPAERAAKLARRASATVDVGRVQRELDRTEQALGRLTVDRARRDITEQAYRLAAAELEQAAEALRRQLDQVQVEVQAPPPRGAVAAARQLLEHWDAMPVDRRNRVLRLLVREVRVRRAAVYREPLDQGRVQVAFL